MPAGRAQTNGRDRAEERPFSTVAIANTSPAYRQGLAHALSRSGFTVEEPDDVFEWACRPGPRLLVLDVAGDDFDRLPGLARSPEARLVVLIADASRESLHGVLAADRCFPVARDAPVEEIVDAVKAAAKDRVVLPIDDARALLARGRFERSIRHVTTEELSWLEALASGTTVSRLARSAGYSEREMYRRLNALYRKMGAAGRVEAMINASRWGLIGGRDRGAPPWSPPARREPAAGPT